VIISLLKNTHILNNQYITDKFQSIGTSFLALYSKTLHLIFRCARLHRAGCTCFKPQSGEIFIELALHLVNLRCSAPKQYELKNGSEFLSRRFYVEFFVFLPQGRERFSGSAGNPER